MSKEIVPLEQIAHAIVVLRGQKVMLDFDLARLYGVPTKVLNQAVKRNRKRFPDDFMFRLASKEMSLLRSQFVTLKSENLPNQWVNLNRSQTGTSPEKRGGQRYRPYAFTEQGVAMLSSVLNSDRAVKVNIAIMRAFVKLRQALDTDRALARKFSELESRVGKHDEEIGAIIEAIRQLIAPPEKPAREIGFHVRETAPRYRTRKVR